MTRSNAGLVALALLALSCEKGGSKAPQREPQVGYAEAARVRPGAATASAPPSAPDRAGLGTGGGEPVALVMADTMMQAPEPTAPGSVEPKTAPSASATAMIIRTGTATIKVDSLEPAVARLRALALSVGGYVGNTSMQTGSDQLRSATVEIKVPAPRWGQLLSGLKPIGTLEAQEEDAEDVGEEFVDVQARVANARRLEARLIDLLANRTGKLSDALSVERELARVREEIERYEGRIRYLQTRTAISTMVVTVHEAAPVLGSHPGDNPIGEAFRQAWRIFVGVIAFLIASLGVLIPLAIVAWVVWMLRGRWLRKS